MKLKYSTIFILAFFFARCCWFYIKEGNPFSDFLGTLFITFFLLMINRIFLKDKG